jgi:hypothetical protein
MRCHEVVRELAVPTGHPDASGLAEHLARCPRCASWAEDAARLDRLWEATRPAEPTASRWETTWADVSQALDRGSTPEPAVLRPGPHRPWRRSTLVAFGLAQAAAILIAVGFFARHDEAPAPAELVNVEIPYGQPVLIRCDLPTFEVIELPDDENLGVVDSNFDMLNDMEGMAYGDAMALGDVSVITQ